MSTVSGGISVRRVSGRMPHPTCVSRSFEENSRGKGASECTGLRSRIHPKDTFRLARARSVLTRGERIKILKDEERWKDDQGPYGLPKVRVVKLVVKKTKKKDEAKTEEGAEGAAAAGAAAPAADAKKGPEAKKDDKKK